MPHDVPMDKTELEKRIREAHADLQWAQVYGNEERERSAQATLDELVQLAKETKR